MRKYLNFLHKIIHLKYSAKILLVESPRQLLSYNLKYDIVFVRINKYYYNKYSILSTIKYLNKNENIFYFSLQKNISELIISYLVTLVLHFKKIELTVGDKNTFILRFNYLRFLIKKITYIDDGNPCVFDGKFYFNNEVVHSSFSDILEINVKKFKFNLNLNLNGYIDKSYVAIIGNKISDFGINSIGAYQYYEFIKKNYINNNYKIIYYKHRMEKVIPEIFSEKDFYEIKSNKLPLELYFIKKRVIPGTIISLGSSLLASLKMLNYKGNLIGINGSNFIENKKIKKSYDKYFYYLEKGSYCNILTLRT